MALQKQLWTINGLSTELGHTRRSLAKWLQGLPPKKIDGKVKYWELADVIEHLSYRRGSSNPSSSTQENHCLFRAFHDLTLSYFTFWLYEEMAQAFSGLLVEMKVPEKKNLEICKQLWELIVYFTEQFNNEDVLNKILLERGISFDSLHLKHVGEKILSKPSKLNFGLPGPYLSLLTPKNRKELEEAFEKSLEKNNGIQKGMATGLKLNG